MNHLFKRLTPLIKGVSDKGKACCDPLTQEMADQARTVREAGYDLQGPVLTKQDVIYIEKFTNVYNPMCAAIIAVENGKKKAFDAAAMDFEPRFNRYVNNLKTNLGDVKYVLLSKKVDKNIKKPSASELHFPAVSRLSPSYSSVQLAD
jgi:hypothetical protein